MTSISAIVTAGGIGQRMGGGIPKQFLPLAGVPIIVHTIRAFHENPAINQIILVVPLSHLQLATEIVQYHCPQTACQIIVGGRERQDSVEAGMNAADCADLLVVHDGARPLVSQRLINTSIAAAKKHGAAIVAIPVKDTLKSVAGRKICETIDRTGLWLAQTPQVVKRDLLKEAYAFGHRKGFVGTDEASLLENMGHTVAIVNGSEENIKITRPEDLTLAEAFMLQRKEKIGPQTRIGHGYDAHRLVENRKLVLGGVTIAHEKGLLGHSDADVICHALCDAILGAIGAGDIGQHFPDSEPQYQGISSLKLLVEVARKMADKGWRLGNADITVVAQRPKLAPYLGAMRQNMAKACGIDQEMLNIKATTTEEMGFAGRQEGIACHGVVMVIQR